MSRKPIRRVSLSSDEQRAMALYLESMGVHGLSQCLGVSRVSINRAVCGQPVSPRAAAAIRQRISPSQIDT